MKSKLQEVAGLAYECVKGVKGKEFEGKYYSHVRKLPFMIVHNGLLTTVAFIRAKSKDEGWQKIEEHIKLYLERIENNKQENLIEFFAKLSLAEYRLYTKKLLYFAEWLKRIAEGELKHDKQD